MNKRPNQTTQPAARLWLALVDHQVVPGTRPVLFAQPTEPQDPEIFSRFSADAGADELEVSGLYDLSLVISGDSESRKALEHIFQATPPAQEIPCTVKDRVRFTLSALREQEAALQGVERARGKGHILALELQDREARIRHGVDRLNEFRTLAGQNGVDAEAFIQECGGVPDFGRFGYMHPNPPAAPETTDAGMSDAEVVQGAERMARVLLKAWGFAFSGECVRNSENPRAISAWSVVTAMLEEYNGTDLSSAVDSCETEGVEVQVVAEAGPRPDPIGAAQFFKELLDSKETLGNVAYDYGPRTLADLMYLQNAIAKGTFIDHYPEESSVMVVVQELASADRWSAYVQQVGDALPNED